MTDEELKALFAGLRQDNREMREEADLYHRLQSLEQSHQSLAKKVHDLQSRVERLESSTHLRRRPSLPNRIWGALSCPVVDSVIPRHPPTSRF
jgi:uncharacterized protein YlxW (UPF0749 family)